MPDFIPAELQEEFMNEVDTFIRRTLRSTKRKYERRERRNKAQLILNEVINGDGDELIDYLVGSKDIECEFDFMDSIDNDKLFYSLESLSPKEKKLIKMKFCDDYSNEEISELLNCKKDSVYEEISRTISKIRKYMN